MKLTPTKLFEWIGFRPQSTVAIFRLERIRL
jgi:hypothetical protein